VTLHTKKMLLTCQQDVTVFCHQCSSLGVNRAEVFIGKVVQCVDKVFKRVPDVPHTFEQWLLCFFSVSLHYRIGSSAKKKINQYTRKFKHVPPRLEKKL